MTSTRARYMMDKYEKFGSLYFSWEKDWSSHGWKHTSGYLSADGITPEENEYIELVWSLMPSGSSYYNALTTIAKGP